MSVLPSTSISDNGAIELSWRLVMVTSLLVGFNAHSVLSNLRNDYTALWKKARWPEKVSFNLARLFGLTFLVTSLVILELPANHHTNCNRNTRLAICAFFLSHGVHHLQFGLRLLSLYRHRWELLVLQLAGCIVILGLCLFAAIESHSGIILPSNGCVLLFDSSTLPDRTSLLILAGFSVCHQAFTTILAVVKLYQKGDPESKDGSPRSIYTALMVDGIPYWIARLLSVTVFFLLPVAFFVDHTMLLMTSFAIHTAFDVELSALILRSSPTSRAGDRRSSFGILGEAKDQSEKPAVHAPSIKSRFSGMTLFPKEMKEQHTGEMSSSSAAASVDMLPRYRHYSMFTKDWDKSSSTFVSEQQAPRSKTYDTGLTHMPPQPTRPPTTRSTRIPRSLQRAISTATSRYASVIQFYQDSPLPTPEPPVQDKGWTVTRVTPPRPPSISRSVSATPPPGWI